MLNPDLQIPIALSGIIDTTSIIRIPELSELLFSWIQETNSKSDSLDADVPLEVVIIGVGNDANSNKDSNNADNHTAPQVLETIVLLSTIKTVASI